MLKSFLELLHLNIDKLKLLFFSFLESNLAIYEILSRKTLQTCHFIQDKNVFLFTTSNDCMVMP
jgi:hypothetical protein